MRTTVTLDSDVAARVREFARRSRTSFKEALNTLLRRGLSAQQASRAGGPRFRVVAHAGGFRPGIDLGKLNQLSDQLEADAFAAKSGARR